MTYRDTLALIQNWKNACLKHESAKANNLGLCAEVSRKRLADTLWRRICKALIPHGSDPVYVLLFQATRLGDPAAVYKRVVLLFASPEDAERKAARLTAKYAGDYVPSYVVVRRTVRGMQ